MGTEVQRLYDKPWKNTKLQEEDEVLPPTRIKELQHADRGYESSTGVGTDGFHPKLPRDLTEEGCAMIIDILTKVEAVWILARAGKHSDVSLDSKDCDQ